MQRFNWRPSNYLFHVKDEKRAHGSTVFADRLCAAANAAIFLAGVAIITGLFIFYLRKSGQAQYFTAYSLLEEAAYTFTSANNYLRFGYLNSALLQDFATSPHAADHPYVYNHMPPGPDLVMSVLLWLTGGNYVWVRTIFASSVLAGFVVYFLFGRALLQNLGVRFSGTLLILVSPWIVIQLFDRQVYSPNILFTFLPLLLVLIFLRNEKREYFLTSLALIAIFSFYIEYSMLAAVIFCWGMFYVTQLMPLKFRHLVAIGAAFGIGIGTHLVQNMLFLGWDNFSLELRLAISNRTTGFPTQEQLRDFYHRLGVVHHGSRPVDLSALTAQIRANFSSPVMPSAALMLTGCSLWLFSGRGFRFNTANGMPLFLQGEANSAIWLFYRLIAWIVPTVLAPIILFPAFAQEVNLRGSGAHSFFLAIPLTFLVGYSFWILFYASHRAAKILIDPKNAEGRPLVEITEAAPAVAKFCILIVRTVALVAICLAFVNGAIVVLANTRNEIAHIRLLGQKPDKWAPLYEIRRFRGELFMTNINIPTVGFLTEAPGFGTCGPNSISADGQLRLQDCKTAFMRRYDYWSAQRPRYFFYFTSPELFPGFADCLPANVIIGSTRGGDDCMEKMSNGLAGRYPLVMKNDIVSVFDLGKTDGAKGGN